MTSRQKKIVIAVSAGLVLVIGIVGVVKLARLAVLAVVGLVFFGLVVFLIFRIWQHRKTKTIFGFYVAANDILTDEDRSRYHFEITQAIASGEKVVRSMPDAPPLSRFALGALYYSINDHNAAVEQLGFAAEEEVLKESSHVSPSRQLKRYVRKLRKIERSPKRSAKIKAALASLEQMHQERAARLLAESQQQLKRMVEAYDSEISEQLSAPRSGVTIASGRSLKSITAPPPISEVLNDIYQEEPKAS